MDVQIVGPVVLPWQSSSRRLKETASQGRPQSCAESGRTGNPL